MWIRLIWMTYTINFQSSAGVQGFTQSLYENSLYDLNFHHSLKKWFTTSTKLLWELFSVLISIPVVTWVQEILMLFFSANRKSACKTVGYVKVRFSILEVKYHCFIKYDIIMKSLFWPCSIIEKELLGGGVGPLTP